MTRETVIAKMKEHNAKVDYFQYVELPELLGIKDGQEVTATEWFSLWASANHLADERKFYEQGMALVKEARAEGHDIKINAQTNKVCGYGING